jgi:hypothetical protein
MGQAPARPRVSSSPLLRVVLHLPQGKVASNCFSCCSSQLWWIKVKPDLLPHRSTPTYGTLNRPFPT